MAGISPRLKLENHLGEEESEIHSLLCKWDLLFLLKQWYTAVLLQHTRAHHGVKVAVAVCK